MWAKPDLAEREPTIAAVGDRELNPCDEASQKNKGASFLLAKRTPGDVRKHLPAFLRIRII